MSIKVQFYNCPEDRKKINKNLNGKIGGEISCVLKENCSILEPSIRVSMDAVGESYASINYCFIPEFGRYYFVGVPIVEPGQAITYNLEVDPLMTYATGGGNGGLMNTQFMIARAEKEGNNYFIDTERALQNRKVVQYEVLGHIPQATTGNRFAITVAGGV